MGLQYAFRIAEKIDSLCCNCLFWQEDKEHGGEWGICEIKYARMYKKEDLSHSLTKFTHTCDEKIDENTDPLQEHPAIICQVCGGPDGCKFLAELERRVTASVIQKVRAECKNL